MSVGPLIGDGSLFGVEKIIRIFHVALVSEDVPRKATVVETSWL